MADCISGSDDIIESRNVIARIEELEADIEVWEEDIIEHQNEIDDKENEIVDLESEQELRDTSRSDVDIAIENEIGAIHFCIDSIAGLIQTIRNDIQEAAEELSALTQLAEQCEQYTSEWAHGAVLISEDHFTDYAKEVANDTCAPNLSEWPCNHIDWEAAADALIVDYTNVDFEGWGFWVRMT